MADFVKSIGELQLPITAYLYENEKGYFCRIHVDGKHHVDGSQGKMFFPDRSCKNLCKGPVIIEEVKDMGNYCFFKGHMQQFESITDDQLEIILRNTNASPWQTINFLHGPCGDFITGVGHWVKNPEDGSPIFANFQISGLDSITERRPSMEVADFICQRHHNLMFEELTSKFMEFEWDLFGPDNSPKFVSHAFDKAIKYFVIRFWRYANIDFVLLDEESLFRALTEFTTEELESIFADASKINTKANEQVAAAVKKGKMRLATKRP